MALDFTAEYNKKCRLEEGKLNEDENSDGNNYESDGDTDVENDDHINPDK